MLKKVRPLLNFSPFNINDLSKCRGIDLFWFNMVSLLNFFAHLSRAWISSFQSLYCLSLYTTSSIRCHTFSMMFRSGLRADQDSHFIRLQVLQHFFAVRILALSWYQIHLFWPNRPRHHKIKIACRSSRQFRLLYLPLKTFFTRLSKLEMAPQIMTPHHPFEASLDSMRWLYHLYVRRMN